MPQFFFRVTKLNYCALFRLFLNGRDIATRRAPDWSPMQSRKTCQAVYWVQVESHKQTVFTQRLRTANDCISHEFFRSAVFVTCCTVVRRSTSVPHGNIGNPTAENRHPLTAQRETSNDWLCWLRRVRGGCTAGLWKITNQHFFSSVFGSGECILRGRLDRSFQFIRPAMRSRSTNNLLGS